MVATICNHPRMVPRRARPARRRGRGSSSSATAGASCVGSRCTWRPTWPRRSRRTRGRTTTTCRTSWSSPSAHSRPGAGAGGEVATIRNHPRMVATIHALQDAAEVGAPVPPRVSRSRSRRGRRCSPAGARGGVVGRGRDRSSAGVVSFQRWGDATTTGDGVCRGVSRATRAGTALFSTRNEAGILGETRAPGRGAGATGSSAGAGGRRGRLRRRIGRCAAATGVRSRGTSRPGERGPRGGRRRGRRRGTRARRRPRP